MSDIFISFTREDRAVAEKLANSLMQFGWSVWWDTKLSPGQFFDDVIERELNDARWVIVLWSEEAVRSNWVREEAYYALERSTLLPVMINSVNLPLGFRSIQTLDLIDWKGEQSHPSFQRLIELLSTPTEEKANTRASKEEVLGRPLVAPLKAGSSFRDGDARWCPEMITIPPGKFIMGSPESENEADSSEKPLHEVIIERLFAIGIYAVTFNEYDYFANVTGRALPNDEGWGRGQRPVINVSWLDAKEYVAWLSQVTGTEYSLPNEAEWEYACRAGTTTQYWCGDAITQDMANFGATAGRTTRVGNYPPNPWGLYDTHGNVWEWVEDIWHTDYLGAPIAGVSWTESGDRDIRVSRGGSWINAEGDLRSACRDPNGINKKGGSLGFRVVRRF